MSLGQINVPDEIKGQFFFLLSQNRTCEALALLPEPDKQKFEPICHFNGTTFMNGTNSTNATVGPPLVQTFTERSILSGQDELIRHEKLALAYAWIIIITSVLGIIGNSLVIITHSRRFNKAVRKRKGGHLQKGAGIARMLFIHLACCDLLFAVLQAVLISPSINRKDWFYGVAMCKIILGAVLLGSLVAIGTILIIASERHNGSFKLELVARSRGKVLLKLALVWAAALVTISPYMVALDVGKVSGTCEADWAVSSITLTGGKVYDIFLLIFWFMIPCTLIWYYYGAMVNLLRRPMEQRGLGPTPTNKEYMVKRRRGDLRAVKILLSVMMLFMVFCIPIRIVRIILDFVDTSTLTQGEFFALIYIGLLPYPFHVCCNPIIYSMIDPKFQHDLKEIFCCYATWGQPTSESTRSSSGFSSVWHGFRKKVFRSQYTLSSRLESSVTSTSKDSSARRGSEIPENLSTSKGVFFVELNAFQPKESPATKHVKSGKE